MDSKLRAALGYAAKGWPVFPCRPGTKVPLGGKGVHDATTDADQIRRWWEANPDCNIGFHVGAANLMAVDYDCDDEAVDEFATLHDLDETLSVITPNGCHEYYATDRDIPPSAGKVAPNVDIRSAGSYTLLPPSSTPDGEYRWSNPETAPINATPSLVSAACDNVREKADNPKEINVEEDKPENVQRYIEWLRNDAKIPETGRRNNTLASTAAMGHSFAISTAKTVELIKLYWNPRLPDPLDDDEIDISGTSGHRSASSAQGNMTTEYHTRNIKSLFDVQKGESATDGRFRIIDRLGMESIEPPEWLIDDMLVRETYAMLYGAPGSYKTFLALDLALSIAARHDSWLDGRRMDGKNSVLFVAGEGRSGLAKRVRAWEHENNEGNRVENFFLADPVPQVADGFDQFVAVARHLRERYDLIVLDTVSRTLAGQNENAQETASALTAQVDALRREFGATILALHHTGHQQEGKASRERGSSVFRGDVDTLLELGDGGTLTMVKQKDAERWEEPIILEPRKVLDSLVLKIAGKEEKNLEHAAALAHREARRMTATDQAKARIEARALELDAKCAELMAKAPVGKRMTAKSAGEYLAGAETLSIGARTWANYLGVLKTKDTITRKRFYEESTTNWINRG